MLGLAHGPKRVKRRLGGRSVTVHNVEQEDLQHGAERVERDAEAEAVGDGEVALVDEDEAHEEVERHPEQVHDRGAGGTPPKKKRREFKAYFFRLPLFLAHFWVCPQASTLEGLAHTLEGMWYNSGFLIQRQPQMGGRGAVVFGLKTTALCLRSQTAFFPIALTPIPLFYQH